MPEPIIQSTVFETEPFYFDHQLRPEDRSLAVDNQDDIPLEFLELWYRFKYLGFIDASGDQCIFLAYTLKRIMRYHGYSVAVKQVVSYYENRNRGWKQTVGAQDQRSRPTVGIDTHAVVVSKGFILDFARKPIYDWYGSMAPQGFIVKNKNDVWADTGFFGRIKYVDRLDHPETNNERILTRSKMLNFTEEYFRKYRA
jgi:hypothetical protein